MEGDVESPPTPHQSRRYSGDLSGARASMTLEEKHEAMNSLFGMKPFKSHISKRRLEDRSAVVRQLYGSNKKAPEPVPSGFNFGNILWVCLFGWILYIFYAFVAILLWISYFGRKYSDICWKLKNYFLWPFGKYLEKSYIPKNMYSLGSQSESIVEENSHLLDNGSPSVNGTPPKHKGYVLWCIIAIPILCIVHVIMLGLCWLFVVFIPMAKVHREILKLIVFGDPLTLNVVQEYPNPGAEILLYTNQAVNIYYYKYTIGGMNVVLLNLLPFVVLSLIFGYLLEDVIPPIIIFVCCLLSTIPLSYYNGMAISSISAQTSFAVGALLTASFGSIIEMILYIANIKAEMPEVARSAMTGALLGALLFIPGLSMIIGGIKYKEQRFNPAVTGVSSVLLVISVIGAFSPTLYYMLYGNYKLTCSACALSDDGMFNCQMCNEQQVPTEYDSDPVYFGQARTLMFICSAILPVAYIIGLLFTLKTHAHILHVKPDEDEEEEGEANPEWSKAQCVVVLIVCTVMFSLISEKLVDTINPVVDKLHLTRTFMGATVLAVVPSAAEYLNAIQFALHNNMSLAIEIGTSSAVQITLFQMPLLVVISAIMTHMQAAKSFTLIFPMLDFYAVFFSVIILNLIYQNGKSNYFIGTSLVTVYVIIVSCFFFIPE